jgi:hypothetical protein
MAKLITIGQLIDNTWDHYRKHFIELMSISGWLLVLAIINIIALVFYPTGTKLFTGAALDGSEQFGVILFSISAYIIAPIIGLWIFAATVRLVSQQLTGNKTDVRRAMKDGWKAFWPLLIVSALVLLVLIGGMAIGLGPGFILAAIAWTTNATSMILIANIILVLGVFVAFALNLRWSVHYMLAPFAYLLENKTKVSALKRARALISGRFWKTLLLLIAPKAVFILFGVAAMALLAFVTGIFINMTAGLNVDVQLRLLTITSTIYPIILAVLINPLISITDIFLYKSLQEVAVDKS